MIEQEIGTVPTLPQPPSLERINTFDDEGVAYAEAQNVFGEALGQRAVELNIAFGQVNTTHEEINTLKSDTQAIKESAITALETIKTDAEDARDEAILARDEAVGAVATLPSGIINDSTVSATDTWSSQKIKDASLTLAQIQATALYF